MYNIHVFAADPNHTVDILQQTFQKYPFCWHPVKTLQDIDALKQQHPPDLFLFDHVHAPCSFAFQLQQIQAHNCLRQRPRVFLCTQQDPPPEDPQAIKLLHPMKPSLFVRKLLERVTGFTNSRTINPPTSLPQMQQPSIGPFRILSRIGKGGMGEVFLAEQEQLQRRVALKVMLPTVMNNRICQERFRREALATAKLNNPHIVHIYDAGITQDGLGYIAMEYIEGGNLDQWLQERGMLNDSLALDITRQVAIGLHAAHQKQQVHRDIKPSNLLITPEGRVVITDFGLVQQRDAMRCTHPGTILGSPHYIAPEQACGQIVKAPADIYSLGVVLYQMLTGELPFCDPSIANVLLQQLHIPLPSPQHKNPNVQDETLQLLRDMTHKSPQMRIQDCETLVARLDALLPRTPSLSYTTVPQQLVPSAPQIHTPIPRSTLDSISSNTTATPLLSNSIRLQIEEVLTLFVGPMAKVLLKKTTRKMGFSPKTFPKTQSQVLLNKLVGMLPEEKQDALREALLPLLLQQETPRPTIQLHD